jgi:hypothetical protein
LRFRELDCKLWEKIGDCFPDWPRFVRVFSAPACDGADYSEIRRPIQWNAATEYGVVQSGDCVRRGNSFIQAAGA